MEPGSLRSHPSFPSILPSKLYRSRLHRSHTLLRLIVPLLLVLLSCQTAWQLTGNQPLQTATQGPTRKPTATLTVTPSPTVSPTSTASQPPPTHTPTTTPTLTPVPPTATLAPTILSLDQQLRIFNELWEIVRQDYLYPDFNGLDWDAVYALYEERIVSGLTNREFYLSMDEMIFSLGDEHSIYLSPEMVVAEEREFAGDYDFIGIGVLMIAVPERQKAVILAVFPGSPAALHDLKPRDSILSVNGSPIFDEAGHLQNLIRGREGTRVTIVIQTPGEEPREVSMDRQRIKSILPVPHTVFTTASGKRIGYMLLVTFADSTIDDSVADALVSMSIGGLLDGLVIDVRPNPGGADTVVRSILSYFTEGTLGYWVARDGERPLGVNHPRDIRGSQKVPLAILVGLDTISFGEIFAGVLQDTGRAYVIGETTGGNVETLWGYSFEDGSRLWLAREAFRPLNNPQVDWELTGIIPDQVVLANWDEYTLETDPLILAAVDYLDGH